METSAFELLIVPTLWVTFGGIVMGAALLFLMHAAESILVRLGRANHNRDVFASPARNPRPTHVRPVARGAVRFHG